MSVIQYWQECLEKGVPLLNEQFLEVEAVVRYSGISNWPTHVSRNGFFYDYILWCRKNNVPIKKHFCPRNFHTNFNKILFVNDRTYHIVSMRVRKPAYFEGSWFTEEMYQKFIKLCSLEEHRAKLFEVLDATRTH